MCFFWAGVDTWGNCSSIVSTPLVTNFPNISSLFLRRLLPQLQYLFTEMKGRLMGDFFQKKLWTKISSIEITMRTVHKTNKVFVI